MGVDFGVRIVATQDRLGVIRSGATGTVRSTVETETPTFVVVNVRGYWNPRENINFVAGVENLFDSTYLEHLDLRLASQTISPEGGAAPPMGRGERDFNPAFAYAPGITPYIGMTVTY
jgi:outer membrane receptor protein involved in Fe transport